MTLKRIFFFRGAEYWRYDWTLNGTQVDTVDTTRYPRALAGPWRGLFTDRIDAAFCWRNGQAYFFHGAEYSRYNALLDRVDDGYPKLIADQWGGTRGTAFESDIDAALHWGNGQVYWFKGSQYIRLQVTDTGWRVDPGYPKDIGANWPGVAGTGFESDLCGCVNWGDGNIYWFKGSQYVRLTEKPAPQGKSMDADYPKDISSAWPGVPTGGFDACLEWPYAEVAAGTFAVPSGAQPIVTSGGRKQAFVTMDVDFVPGPDPGTCAVGEYRQRVRGAFTRFGVDQRFPLGDPGCGPPVDFDRVVFREDGLAAPPAGLNTFYGHRQSRCATDIAGTGDASDQYLPDRPTGCQYRGTDPPGTPDIAGRGLHAEFVSEAIDRGCDGEVLLTSSWTVDVPE